MLMIDLGIMGNCDVVLCLHNAMHWFEEPFIPMCMVTKLKFHWLLYLLRGHNILYTIYIQYFFSELETAVSFITNT